MSKGKYVGGAIYTSIGVDIKELRRGFKDAKRDIKNFGKFSEKEMSNIGKRMGKQLSNSMLGEINKGNKKVNSSIGNINNKSPLGVNIDTNKIKEDGYNVGKSMTDGVEKGISANKSKIDNSVSNTMKSIKNISKKEMQETSKMTVAEYKKMFTNIENIGKKGIKRVSLPILAGITAMSKSFMDFEDSMAHVNIMLGSDSQRGIQSMSNEVIKLSDKFVRLNKEVSEAQYNALSLGIDEKDTEKFLDPIMKLADVGQASILETSRATNKIIESYAKDINDVPSITDKIFEARKQGDISVDDISTQIGRISSNAAIAGISIDELLASVSSLSKVKDPSLAFTGIKAALSNLSKPTDRSRDVAELLGIDMSSKHIQDIGWASFLDELREKTAGNKDALDALFGSTEAAGTMAHLLTAGYEDFNRILGEIENSSGTVEEEFKKLDTTGRSLRESLNHLYNTAAMEGSIFKTSIDSLSGAIMKVSQTFRDMPDSMKSAISSFTTGIMVFFPAIKIIGTTGKAISSLSDNIVFLAAKKALLSTTAQTTASSVASVGSKILGLVSPTTVAVTAIGTLGSAFILSRDKSKISTDGMMDNVRMLGVKLFGFGKRMKVGALSLFRDVGEAFGRDVERMNEKLEEELRISRMMMKQSKDYLVSKEFKGISGSDTRIVEHKNRSYLLNERTAKSGFISDEVYKKYREGNFKTLKQLREENKLLRGTKEEINKVSNKNNTKQIKGLSKTNDEIQKVMDNYKELGKNKSSLAKKAEDEAKRIVDSINSVADSMRSAMGIGDRIKTRPLNSFKIMRAAKEQEKALIQRAQALESLERKGVSGELLSRLHKLGISDVGKLRGLDERLSPEQLKEWMKIEESKERMIQQQAINTVNNDVNIGAINIYGAVNENGLNKRKVEDEIYGILNKNGVYI